jgi:HlyD family secretion protein
VNRKLSFLLLGAAVAGCTQSGAKPVQIQTATIQRRSIIVAAEATGVIEPINIIEVKSKTASGQVMEMPVDIGSFVRPGDLIVQVDTTNIRTQYNQSVADFAAAQANFDVADTQLKRQESLFSQHIITKMDLESAQTAFASAQDVLVRNKANLDLAKQSLVDARVTATVTGTIITKPVSIGQVIQAGATSVSGGTVIATMADLTKVRARALVNETDIGQVAPGQEATVIVDAFPDHPFVGVVEKIEPVATVQQNVTMFPVLINLDNAAGLLKSGMNGEVTVRTDQRDNVIAVPNDAIRSPREATQAAAILGLNPDSVRAQLRGSGGQGGGRGVQVQVNRGELDLPLQGGGTQGAAPQGGGRGPQVTDADCKKVDDAMKKNPAAAGKIADMRTKMRDPSADRQAMRGDMKKLYDQLGVDMAVSGACARRASGDVAGAGRGQPGGRGQRGGAAAAVATGGAGAGASGGGRNGGRGGNAANQRRTGLVFVQNGATWTPKTIHLGVANYDYTEVLDDGLKEGDKVAMLSAAALQAKRQEQNDRLKAGASPLGGSAPAGGGRGGGRGG